MFQEELPSWVTPIQTRVEEEEEEQESLPSWVTPVQQTPIEPVEQLPSWATPVTPEEPEPVVDTEPYAPSALLETPKLAAVDRFLGTYYGVDSIDGYEPQERVDKFVNTWRYLMAGNSVKALGFVEHVLSTDDVGRSAVVEGYDLFQGLGGKYSLGENFDRIRDYAAGAILDPVNIVAPLVGKAVAQTGSTATMRFAIEMARKEAARLATAGASRAVQVAAANQVKGRALRSATARVGRAQAYKEVMGAAAFDTAVAVGADVAFQHGLIQAGAQEEQNRVQTGLAALGGIVGGGLAAGVVSLRGTSGLGMANIDVQDISVTNAADLRGVLSELADSLDAIPENKFVEVFGAKVKRGIELEEVDTTFWGKLLTGDDEVGFKGLGQIMYDKGFRYLGKRDENDNFTNWLADAFNNSPDDDVLKFVKAFQDKTGITFKGMKNPTAAELADNMSRKMSDSGFSLNAMSRTAKMLRFKDVKNVTVEDYYAYLFGDVVGDSLLRSVGDTVKHSKHGVGTVKSIKDGKVTVTFKGGDRTVFIDDLKDPPGKLEAATGKAGEFVNWAQDSYIRLLVTHPGTSALNIAGWSTKTVGQSASDLLRATTIYGSSSLYNAVLGRGDKAGANWKLMTGAYKANIQKVRNLLDMDTTAKAFNSLVESNPKAFKDIMGVLPGGVTRPMARDLGLDDVDQPLYQRLGEKSINNLQVLGLVKAQDVVTKSQEMMYNLDIALREAFGGMGYKELISSPDAKALMSTRKYTAAQNKAIERTLENILSKSYSKHDNVNIARVAGFIEDFRSIPVVGATIPFGRFFNNVIATMSEYSGANIVLKAGGVAAKNRDWGETIAKPLVAWTAVAATVGKEQELLERGIAWDVSIDESTGQRYSERFDSPAIGVKAAARYFAYKQSGQEIPEEFLVDAADAVLGQLTRQLSASGDAFLEGTLALLQGENEQAIGSLMDSLTSVGGTLGSGVTRFAEPINTLVSLGDTPQDYMAVDVKTGNPGFAKAFRYIDQLVGDNVTGETLPSQSPTEAYVGRQPAKMIGQRALGPTTAASRVFAMAGRRGWDADLFADDKVAQNIVTQEFNPVFEVYAQRLLDNPVFIDGDTQLKSSMLSDALISARETTHRTLQASTNPDNPRLSALFKLTQQTSVANLEEYMKELGFEEEGIHDLTTTQLETLKFFIDNDEEFELRDAYRRMRNR